MRLLRAGKSYRQIGFALGVTEQTVRTFIGRAYRKLGVHSRYDLPRV